MTTVERFAPSPTGPLHLGHAYSAILAHDAARASGGRFLVRIEDLDQSRSRHEWEMGIFDDLNWLGLNWEKPVMRQSERGEIYRSALARLWDAGLLFACHCSRRDIAQAAPQEGAPLLGPDGMVYPGTCRIDRNSIQSGPMPKNTVLRLNASRAAQAIRATSFEEIGPVRSGRHQIDPNRFTTEIGDVALARSGMVAAYHLAVVVDDAAQGVTHVTRGEDLFAATFIHVLLQRLLDLPTPVYRHHQLIRDDAGKRLAKRHDAKSIARFRAEGLSPKDIRSLVGL